MNNSIKELKNMFKQGDLLTKLIFINSAVFLLVALTNMMLFLFKSPYNLRFILGLPSKFDEAMGLPWTFFTYMFLHEGFIHFILNMFMLYWVGRIFLSVTYAYNQRDLVNLYIFGGLIGGLTFIIAFNVFPALVSSLYVTTLEGASASIMALLTAAAYTQPDSPIRLTFIGEVKLKWMATAIFAISVLTDYSSNTGGCFSHLGGGLAGVAFAYFAQKGTNIAAWVGKTVDVITNTSIKIADTISGWFNKTSYKKPKFKVVYDSNEHKNTADEDYNMRKKADNDDIDAILDKIKISGYGSLTDEEKQKLFNAGGK